VVQKQSHFIIEPKIDNTRQLNIDYSVCKCLMTIPPNLRVVAIYDVACQFFIHFLKRIKESPYLEIP